VDDSWHRGREKFAPDRLSLQHPLKTSTFKYYRILLSFAFESECVEGALCNGRANKYEYVILTLFSSIVFPASVDAALNEQSRIVV
jgi:hypothetical protein